MKRALRIGLALWLIALAAGSTAYALGLRLNVSRSVPLGLYRLSRAEPRRGDYVALCPPRSSLFKQARERGYLTSGFCPGDFGPLIKIFAAGEGDRVVVDRDGVRINDQLWPQSTPLSADSSGWILPQLTGLDRELGKDAVVVMSERCELGFDSRYFGALPRSVLLGAVVPLLTW
jgi:conjugative transfer signal peptidase TraF